jgi:hypothetical protein
VEGTPIRKLVNGQFQPWAYSNNPAYVLLDYLVEEKKIPLEYIDLDSFEAGGNVCDELTEATRSYPTGGSIWTPFDGSRRVLGRMLPLYEANVMIDTAKPFRENVETILETMGDARLVWSQGQYKLSLQYPRSNDVIILSDIITDDRIILGEDINISWPTADQRLNNATVRFSNEFNDFKEDTVSWPPKTSGTSYDGIGGVHYPDVSGWDSLPTGQFINNYGIWSGIVGNKAFTWKIRPYISGTYTLSAVIDTTGSITLNGQTITENNSEWDSKIIHSISIYLNADTVYTINGWASASVLNRAGFAATLVGPDGVQLWNSREPSYTDFYATTNNNAVYLQMLGEDNNIPLEIDMKADGVTDPYHALAKAEETVRTSRSALSITMSYLLGDKYPEPGDIVLVSIKDINLGIDGPFYVKIDTAKIAGDSVVVVEGTRFDYTQLAWNVADDKYAKPKPVFNSTIPAPMYLTYVPGVSDILNAPGHLIWPLVFDSRVSDYVLYMQNEGDDVWKVLGSSVIGRFDLPNLAATKLRFGVVSRTAAGRKSQMTTTSLMNLTRSIPPAPVLVSIDTNGDHTESVKIIWTTPSVRPDGSTYDNHMLTGIYYGTIDDFSLSQKVGDVYDGTQYVHTPTEYGLLYYWLVSISQAGVKSVETPTGPIEISFWERFEDQEIPPAPFNLEAYGGGIRNVLLWENPIHTIGGGHDRTLIFAAEWPLTQEEEPTIDQAQLIATSTIPMYSHAAGLGMRYRYYIKEQSKGGGISDGFAGPADATTSLIGQMDIENEAILESKLVKGLQEKVALIEAMDLQLDDNYVTMASVVTDTNTIAVNAESSAKASASRVTTVEARLDTGDFALVKQELSSIVDQVDGVVNVVAEDVETIQARLDTGDFAVVKSQATAALTQSSNALDSVTAVAADVTTIQVRLDSGDIATILEEASVVVDSVGDINSKYTIKMDVNGYVTGYGLIVTENDGVPDSDFAILANRFSIVSPGAIKAVPFSVVGDTAYLNIAMIRDADITSAKIQNLTADKIVATSLSAISANLGNITAGQLNFGNYLGYNWPPPGGVGAHLSAAGLLVGNYYSGKYIQITADGNLYAPQFNIINGNAWFSGNLSANIINANHINANSITTEKINGHAVTEVSAVFLGGSYSGTIATVALAAVGVSTFGDSVLVDTNFDAHAEGYVGEMTLTANAVISIMRNYVIIYSRVFGTSGISGSSSSYRGVSMSFVDTPPAGWNTYQIAIRHAGNGTSGISTILLSAVSVKK